MAIGVVFYLAEHESQHINANTTDNIDNCNQYQYCFDCVQDDNCGYCSSYNTDTDTDRNTDIDIDTTTGYTACVAGDDSMATQDQQCHSQYYYGTTCPGDATVTIGWIIFILLCSYLFVFAPGMGPMPWCINSEIYPTSVRGLANSIATTVNWGTNFVMSATFLTLMSVATRTGAFFIYSFISIGFFIFFYKFLPETKGVDLENVDKLFKDDLWGQGSIANNDIISDKSDMTNTGQKQHQSNVNQHKQQHEQQNNDIYI